MGTARPPSQILVVETDNDARHLAAALFEESNLAVIEYGDWNAALLHLETAADTVVMIFGDLDGVYDAQQLVETIRRRWPTVQLVVTGSRADQTIPGDARYMRKPWLPLEVLIAAENAANPQA